MQPNFKNFLPEHKAFLPTDSIEVTPVNFVCVYYSLNNLKQDLLLSGDNCFNMSLFESDKGSRKIFLSKFSMLLESLSFQNYWQLVMHYFLFKRSF